MKHFTVRLFLGCFHHSNKLPTNITISNVTATLQININLPICFLIHQVCLMPLGNKVRTVKLNGYLSIKNAVGINSFIA